MKRLRFQECLREIFSHAEDCVELIEEKWKMASFVYHSAQSCDYWIKCVEKSQFLKFLSCFLVSNLLFCQIARHTFQLKRPNILGENWCIFRPITATVRTFVAFFSFLPEVTSCNYYTRRNVSKILPHPLVRLMLYPKERVFWEDYCIDTVFSSPLLFVVRVEPLGSL